ncbi:hypothetical protein CLOM_g8625 [Closterium sp. NIES-68]|nr:hypothetical protein CLOM_g8625 [Closterium sp. NIES-68]
MQMINSWFQGGPSFRDEPVSLMDSWRAYEAQGGGLDMESGEGSSSSVPGGGGSSGAAGGSGIPGLSFDAFTPYFQNASDSVNATWSSVSKNVQELPGSIQKQASALPSRKALMYFMLVLATGVLFLFLAFSMFLPVIVLSPQKFAVCFTIGCLLVVGSFFVLKGPMVQLKNMTSTERLPFSLFLTGSMVSTIYCSMVLHSYLLSVISSGAQVLALVYYVVSFFPGGTTGLRFLTSMFTSAASSLMR